MRISSLEPFCFYLGTNGKYFEVFAVNEGIKVNGEFECKYEDTDFFDAKGLMNVIDNTLSHNTKYSIIDRIVTLEIINGWWEKNYGLAALTQKTASFTDEVIDVCNTKGIDKPSAEEISEYISENGFSVDNFIKRYTLKESFENFKEGLSKITFGVTPTEKEIQTFFDKYGNDVSLFCRLRTIDQMKPLVRKTYQRTAFKLSTVNLVKLWNVFIEESGLYGLDSHIYDLRNEEESDYLQKNMDEALLKEIYLKIVKDDVHFIQVIDNTIIAKSCDDIESTIVAYWEEIFERIMLYPSYYNFKTELYCEGDGSTYFDDVFFPVIAKEVGYIVDGNNGTIKEVEK